MTAIHSGDEATRREFRSFRSVWQGFKSGNHFYAVDRVEIGRTAAAVISNCDRWIIKYLLMQKRSDEGGGGWGRACITGRNVLNLPVARPYVQKTRPGFNYRQRIANINSHIRARYYTCGHIPTLKRASSAKCIVKTSRCPVCSMQTRHFAAIFRRSVQRIHRISLCRCFVRSWPSFPLVPLLYVVPIDSFDSVLIAGLLLRNKMVWLA